MITRTGRFSGSINFSCYQGFGCRTMFVESMSTQTWNAQVYSTNAYFVPALGQPVLDLLNPQPGERILDLGCGDGVLTERLVSFGAEVVGVDASAEMIEAAQARKLDARLMN